MKIIKNHKIFYIIIFLILLFFIIYIFYKKEQILAIKNNTNQTITNIELIYSNTKEKIKINELKNKNSYKIKIDTNIEQALNIQFLDENNNKHKETIIGYITKDFKSQKVKINDKFKIE